MKKKTDNFTRMTIKEKGKLSVLWDIFTEIESAMEDVKLRDLSFFNTSPSVMPIISKLPPTLQEK